MKTVCHLTSAHKRCDHRIFFKQCASLQQAGYRVVLVVADDEPDKVEQNIQIYHVGKPKSRIQRFLLNTIRIYKKALAVNADVYHFHDPDLIPIGLLLRLKKKVIYDVHEDVPRDILTKDWIKSLFVRKLIATIFEAFENFCASKFNFVITTTPHIQQRFNKINANCVDVCNYPDLSEFTNLPAWQQRSSHICYIGGLSEIRGAVEMIEAIGAIDNIQLILAGNFGTNALRDRLMKFSGWARVQDRRYQSREGIQAILKDCKAGLVTIYPVVSYELSLPVKMFEYMAAGMPVIASNFPLWLEIIEKEQCGICVDPLQPKQIQAAICRIMQDPANSSKMGANGRKLVEQKYNWSLERGKLLEVYKKLLG